MKVKNAFGKLNLIWWKWDRTRDIFYEKFSFPFQQYFENCTLWLSIVKNESLIDFDKEFVGRIHCLQCSFLSNLLYTYCYVVIIHLSEEKNKVVIWQWVQVLSRFLLISLTVLSNDMDITFIEPYQLGLKVYSNAFKYWNT